MKLPSWEYLTPNSIVDCTFYNVGCLDDDEIRQLAWIGKYHNEPPGTVIIVSPKSRHAGEPRIKVVIGDEWRQHVPDGIDTLAMAGVGSSILGTAALAKDIADQLGQPVLGVVSGTGAIGAPIDGVTGWYLYGTINQLDDFWIRASEYLGAATKFDQGVVTLISSPTALDSAQDVLQELIARPSVTRVIGHSKGSLEIANAVEALQPVIATRPPSSTLKIGTLGAVVAIPDDVGSCQVLGSLDFLGWLNSRPDVARHLIPNVWHSLNPSVPLAMSLHRDVWGKFGPSSAFA